MTEFKVTLEFNDLVYTYGFECECKHDAEKFVEHIQDLMTPDDNISCIKNKKGEVLGKLAYINFGGVALTAATPLGTILESKALITNK